MTRSLLSYALLFIFLFLPASYFLFEKPNGKLEKERMNEKMDNPQARRDHEFKMLRDPKTGTVPGNIFRLEQEFAKTLPQRDEFLFMKGGKVHNTEALTWTERGPNNVGGRTRALGIDIRTNTTPNITIIAGGISGGIWKSTNDGTTWAMKTPVSQLKGASCLAQDTRAGKQDIWYVGSGEGTGNSASQSASSTYFGDGLFKTIDNGETWTQLASTQTANASTVYSSDWQFVWNVAIDPSNSTNDVVYAANGGATQRSIDGGTTWTRVQGNGTINSEFYNDVQVSSTGIVYTASSSNSPFAGLHLSINGTDYANISAGVAGFPTVFKRIVIAIAPSNENIVYFLIEGCNGTNGTNQTKLHQLWKYTYISGDGTGAGGSWENRGANLPTSGNGNFGTFNEPFDSQGSYDMIIKVKPNDPNYLFIGGTNIYRSADAFASLNPSNTNYRIAGYQPASENGTYPNHHADQHVFVFLPGSNTIVYTGHDGGISKTLDVTATVTNNNPVTWTSLNNSYNVTQFYNISISPDNGSNFILGGFQDNGSWYGNGIGSTNWTNNNSGDGGFCSVPPSANDWIVSTSQNGALDKYSQSNPASYLGDIKPAGSANPQFINPHQIDPTTPAILYYAAGPSAGTTGIWRNDNVESATTTTGWTYLAGTNIPATKVSAIGVSTAGNAHVVYYGTEDGTIRRIDNANIGASPTVTDITAGLPEAGGYVSSISVDPTNSNKALVTFSNYNFKRIAYTTNGGTNWTNVSGNLDVATAPSVRWAKMFYVSSQLHVFIGTSVGLYYTVNLNGASTVWTGEATSSIGNSIVTSLDFRSSDNTLAVGTHARGAFTTVISSPLPVELTAFSGLYKNGQIQLYWKTATEINNLGFEIERRTSLTGDWKKIGFVNGAGNSSSTREYNFAEYADKGVSYYYRLKQLDNDGHFKYSSTVEVSTESIINTFEIAQNYPNPFNPSTKIKYNIPIEAKISIKVYNTTGEIVRTLVNEVQNPGIKEVAFDASGIASGIYYYVIEASPVDRSESFKQVKKMVLVK